MRSVDATTKMIVCVTLLMASLAPLQAAVDKDKAMDEKKSSGQPILTARLAGFSDAGNFYLYSNEERLGTIGFTWKDDGSFENQCTLSVGGQSAKFMLSITPDKDGRWSSIRLNAGGRETVITHEAALATRTRQGQDGDNQPQERRNPFR